MKRSIDGAPAGGDAKKPGGGPSAMAIPNIPPSLSSWHVAEPLSDEDGVAALQRIVTFLLGWEEMVGAPLSRRNKALLGAADTSVTPILDADRYVLWIDSVTKVLVISLETQPVQLLSVPESHLLLGFSLDGPAALEGYFVFNSKTSVFCFVVTDALLLGGQSLCAMAFKERQTVAVSFVAFCKDKCADMLPFEVAHNRPTALAALFQKILFHEETGSRVLVDGEDIRWPVLGVRFTPASSQYVVGVNELIVEWYFSRQAPVWVLAVAGTEPSLPLLHYFHGNVFAGRFVLNPHHVAAVSERINASDIRASVVKLVYEPSKGWWHVRAIHDINRKLTAAATATALLLHQLENITKEELIAIASGGGKK